MSKYIFAIFLFITGTLAAQPYRSIPSTGAKFRLEHFNSSLGADYNITFASHQMVAGDTVFDGRTVIKIAYGAPTYCACWDPFHAGCDNLMNRKFTPAWLWQDTLSGKVYWTKPGDFLHLMIDFSASAGDTVDVQLPPTTYHSAPSGYLNERYAVTATDTVTFADGIPRKRLFCTSLDYLSMASVNDEHVWVEGIGDLYKGFIIYPDYYWSDPFTLYRATCYQEYSLDLSACYIYASPCNAGTNCDLLVTSPDPAKQEATVIAENPSSQLELRGTSSATRITVYSALAQPVAQATQYVSGPVQGTAELPAGLYWVKVEEPGLVPAVLKWVKE